MENPGKRGFEEYARYINPLIAQRARLAGEPWELVAVRDGLLIDADGKAYEDFHGTQALDQPDARFCRAAGRQKVVDEERAARF